MKDANSVEKHELTDIEYYQVLLNTGVSEEEAKTLVEHRKLVKETKKDMLQFIIGNYLITVKYKVKTSFELGVYIITDSISYIKLNDSGIDYKYIDNTILTKDILYDTLKNNIKGINEVIISKNVIRYINKKMKLK